jgi:NAD(P)H-hydrate epimerase
VFFDKWGHSIPAVTAVQMREVDRLAEEDFGLGVLQMMENAGRNLALHVQRQTAPSKGPVLILAGSGGNGGGGLCCARHLLNHGYEVTLLLASDEQKLSPEAAQQLTTLQAAGFHPQPAEEAASLFAQAKIIVDALLGYSLKGAPREPYAEWIQQCNQVSAPVISLDIPSGLDATTGQAPGPNVRPQSTLTLALPKTGLKNASGELYLADIGIPPKLYEQLGLHIEAIFQPGYLLRLYSNHPEATQSTTLQELVE